MDAYTNELGDYLFLCLSKEWLSFIGVKLKGFNSSNPPCWFYCTYLCEPVQVPVLHKIHGQHLWLSALRAIFWEEQQALIVSDLHFGKTGHFRKSGIAVPQNVYKEDLQRLVNLLHYFNPAQLIVVGDFFHSRANTELEWFKKWRIDFSHLKVILVRGNHDILEEDWYREAKIEVIEDVLYLNSFAFTHEQCLEDERYFSFCGHIHPGILIHGLGKQSLRLPCFYFSKHHCILPAFSHFTGLAILRPEKGEEAFAIAENKLIKIAPLL